MAINNLNPRRTVWFSPHEPSNKYDIWLSKNAHYDENGEPTTDSNAQRDCDYIFKIYDCGKWNPIVGFNSTAANKIDIVEGNTLYHPAIFTGENPNDLYDAGTLGELLANTNFVTQTEWENLFNTTQFIDAFNNVIIDGDEYGWENLIQNIISGGNIEIPFATTSTCGGIYADTFDVIANAFKPVEVKFYPRVSLYSQFNHRLCVNAGDIITQINEWQNENPTQPGINAGGNIELATYNKIGGIHAYADNDTQDTRGVPVMFGGPLVGLTYGGNVPDNQIIYGDFEQYNPDNSFLYVPGWAIREVLKNDLSDDTSTQWDLNVLANYGVDVTKFNITLPDQTQQTAMYFYTLNNYPTNKQGYIPITKWYNSGTYGYTHGLEWIEPNLDFLSDVEINNPIPGQFLVYDGYKWGNASGTENTWRPIQVNDQPIASDYTFDIHSGIGITFSTTQSSREAVCKIEQNILYRNEIDAPTLTGDLIVQAIPVNTSYPHGGCQIEGTYSGSTGNHYLTGPYICRTVLYNVTSASKISFNVAQTPSLFDGNPVYYKLKITGDPSSVSISFDEGNEYIICNDSVISGHLNPKYNNYFITIQFGMVKIEPIMIQSTSE